MSRTGIVSDPTYLEHDTGPSHPESPSRLHAITRCLDKASFGQALSAITPTVPERRWIETVHHPEHIDRIQRAVPVSGRAYLDADTPLSPGSYRAALLAVGGTLAAIDAVMAGTVANAFCAIRPPGHHAEPTRAMGFCLFNNVAIGARYIQQRHGLSKIVILDWDVHHGNGTQAAFYDDSSVFYISLHQFPWYPGTGDHDEVGEGPGEGYTMNVPLPAGRGDDEYLKAFDVQIGPAVRSFAPDFILISTGFDAHCDDPLAGMRVTEEGYRAMTEQVKEWARSFCQGRIVSCLEGGYNLDALSRSVHAHVSALTKAG